MAGAEAARGAARDVAADLDHHLQRGADGQARRTGRPGRRWSGSRRSRRRGRRARPRPGRATPRRAPPGSRPSADRRDDAEALGDVVDHEADDQEASRGPARRARRTMPIARPSPRLCRPMPMATIVASASPASGAPALGARPAPGQAVRHPGQAEVARRDAQPAPGPARRAPPGSAALQRRAPRRAPRPRGTSAGPPVSAMKAASQRGSARRSDGSQSIPSATGTTPTSRPISA